MCTNSVHRSGSIVTRQPGAAEQYIFASFSAINIRWLASNYGYPIHELAKTDDERETVTSCISQLKQGVHQSFLPFPANRATFSRVIDQMKKYLYLTLALLLPLLTLGQRNEQLNVNVHPGVELFTIIQQLAGKYPPANPSKYSEEVNAWFGKYKDHPAVKKSNIF